MSVMSRPRKPLTKIVEPDVRELSIDALKVCPELLQTRDGTDVRVAHNYSKSKASGSVFPPIRVMDDGRDFWVYDGFTRIHAWLSLGLTKIDAVIRKGSIEDALLLGIEANFNPDNIREVKPNDRMHAAELLVRRFSNWPDKEIGLRCGVTGHTVQRIRARLLALEGIPYPERVIDFKNGNPRGSSRPYRRQAINPVRTRNRSDCKNPRYSVSIDGKEVSLGGDRDTAASRASALQEERAEMLRFLKSSNSFKGWLAPRGIYAIGFSRGDVVVGGLKVAEAVVQSIGEVTFDAFLSLGLRLLIARHNIPGVTRCILVGYIRGVNGDVSQTLGTVQALGIEIMTPEEFVAEFGPKGDADDPQAEPAPPAPDRPDTQGG